MGSGRQGFPEARESEQHMGPARDGECWTGALEQQTRLMDFPPRLLGGRGLSHGDRERGIRRSVKGACISF